MSKRLLEEKLDEIHENLSTVMDIGGECKGVMVSKEHFDWLVEQAKQVGKLEELVHIQGKFILKQSDKIEILEPQNEELAVAYNNAQKEIVILKNKVNNKNEV